MGAGGQGFGRETLTLLARGEIFRNPQGGMSVSVSRRTRAIGGMRLRLVPPYKTETTVYPAVAHFSRARKYASARSS